MLFSQTQPSFSVWVLLLVPAVHCLVSLGENLHESFFDSRPLSFTHIPKCAGSSFEAEMSPRIDGQDCYLHKRKLHMMNAVFLRSPRSHVQSQFRECAYDSWGRTVTHGTGFPRSMNDSEKIGDFKRWLIHFDQLKSSQVGPNYDFRCQDPRNTLTRHMSCQYGPNPKANHAMLPPPNLTLAIENVCEVNFLGIADFYHESICILKLRREQTLPPGCVCGDDISRSLHVHKTHNLPSLSPEERTLSPELNSMIDRLISLDAPLFVAGLDRFLSDIKTAESVAKVQIMCPNNNKKASDLLKLYTDISRNSPFSQITWSRVLRPFARLGARVQGKRMGKRR